MPAPKVSISAEPGWQGEIDEQQLCSVIEEEFGLTMPVHVHACDLSTIYEKMGESVPAGARGVEPAGVYDASESGHNIALNVNVPVRHLCKTILHELTHGRQHEALGPLVAMKLYEFCDAVAGYDENPMEIQAERESRRLLDKYPNIIK